ncbi:MAG: cupin domain-containing protein [Alphaproteobacteria bacterium]|nr:cupin domain-containing protein [Alphaproteobacteria bacterium]
MTEQYSPSAINLDDKFGKIAKHWSPHILAQLNDFHVKAVKVQGEFVWHQHDDTDEMFIVYKGALTIKYEDRDVALKAGELHVVPKGVPHKPVADTECEVLIIEPAGTLNTGEAGGTLTAEEEPWI